MSGFESLLTPLSTMTPAYLTPIPTPTPTTPLLASPTAIETMRLLGDGNMQAGLTALLDHAINHLPATATLRLHHTIYRDHKENLLPRPALCAKYNLPPSRINAILRDYNTRLNHSQ